MSTVGLNDLLYEFAAESRQSVPVGNHKLDASAVHCAFQNGFKPFALEVESAANVFDDFMLQSKVGIDVATSLS